MSTSDICDALKTAMTEIQIDGLTGTEMHWTAEGEPQKAPKAVEIKDGKYAVIKNLKTSEPLRLYVCSSDGTVTGCPAAQMAAGHLVTAFFLKRFTAHACLRRRLGVCFLRTARRSCLFC